MSSFPFGFSLADIYFVLNHEQNTSECIRKIFEFAEFCQHWAQLHSFDGEQNNILW